MENTEITQYSTAGADIENTEKVESAYQVAEHTSTGADESILGSLGLNPQLFVFQLINFAIVAFIIWFLILRPLVRQMEERKKMVDESIDNAKEIETNLTQSEAKFKEKIEEARKEANNIIEKAHLDAMTLSEKSRLDTEGHIKKMIKDAEEKLSEERNKMAQDLKRETLGLVTSLSQKFLTKKLNQEDDATLIRDMLDTV